jgi:oxygen-dependent protoporphyrinogen oxidase
LFIWQPTVQMKYLFGSVSVTMCSCVTFYALGNVRGCSIGGVQWSMSSVIIAGGGITGLSAAYRLKQTAPGIAITVLEKTNRLGGIVHTVRENGFVVEAGPDSFLASKPCALRLCCDLGISDHLITPSPRNRGSFVLHDGQLFPLPDGLTGLVPSRLEPLLDSELLSPAAKARLAKEVDVAPAPGSGDESLADFVDRRFGREVYERLIEPLMAGIYAGDGACLSLMATFPQLREMEREYGSVLRAMAARPAAGAGNRTGFMAPQTGMQEIIDALSRALDGVDIRPGETVRELTPSTNGWSVLTNSGVHTADAVILAVPTAVAGGAISHFDPVLGAGLTSIPSASSAIVALAFRRAGIRHSLRGFGYIVPRAETRPALACTWVSSKWSGRAPSGYVLVRVFLGRFGQDHVLDTPDDGLVGAAREELRRTLGIAAPPEHCWLFRWPHVMPQYLVGHRARVAVMSARVAEMPGLYLAGNGYTGVGIPDCIRSAEDAAAAAAHFTRGTSPM